MIVLVAILGWLVAITAVLLLVRATRRLLDFDDLFAQIVEILGEYGDDLRKMASAGILLDHPEVVKFHNRNLRALREMNEIANRLKETRPAEVPTEPLPRPDSEW